MLDILKGKSILVSWTFKILVSDYFYTASSTNTMANSPTKKLFVRSKSKYTLKCQQFWEGEKEKKNAAAGRIFLSEEYLYKIRVCIRKGKICQIKRCDNLTKFLLHNIILFGIWILKQVHKNSNKKPHKIDFKNTNSYIIVNHCVKKKRKYSV